MRDNQSATRVNTIGPDKWASLLVKSEAKSAENGTGGIHRAW